MSGSSTSRQVSAKSRAMPSRQLISLAPFLAAVYRLWAWTWRVERVGGEVLDRALSEGAAVIAIWHGEQAIMCHPHGDRGIDVMMSMSRDGALLAGMVPRLGYGVIRGSSSRGALGALRSALRSVGEGRSPALAVDGPRGPIGEPKLGALHLSARTGRPVVYVAAYAAHAIRLNSWDRFVLPFPFSKVRIGYGRMSPPERPRAAVEAAAIELGVRMRALGEDLSSRTSPGRSS
jgi:lysophospholipid acyltransferase (LPLAT)-like uncharacterized protein